MTADKADVTHVDREARRCIEVATRSPLTAHVPSYPAYTVETLTAHIGKTMRIFHAVLSRTSPPSQPERSPLPLGPPSSTGRRRSSTAAQRPVEGRARPDVQFLGGRRGQTASGGTLISSLAVEVGLHRWDLESVLVATNRYPLISPPPR